MAGQRLRCTRSELATASLRPDWRCLIVKAETSSFRLAPELRCRTGVSGWQPALPRELQVGILKIVSARRGNQHAGRVRYPDRIEVRGQRSSRKLERYQAKIGLPPNSWRIRFTPLGETSYFAIFSAAARWKAYIIDEPIISTRSSPLRPILYGRSI